ncbi:hypothetical protein M378DRAFT_15214 [Amanita muscaria Koide BX008]|uniref:Uncharacterized protein n=1 Tax=Amanita muscaria (strain Koide BX008) TaxID=946122 RepID=A0A0C2WRF3_AMAMK|nr:hypothetical protein M378DRAFT_15214 [Amanita muscaria Koide BX008]
MLTPADCEHYMQLQSQEDTRFRATIAATPYSSSTAARFDTGRQPLGYPPIQYSRTKRAFNPWANPAQSPTKVKDVPKPKRSAEVPKRIADVSFSPQAVSPSANTTYTLNKVEVEDFDDDIPTAKLIEMALSSFTTGLSTLKCVPRVKKRAPVIPTRRTLP